MDKLKKFQSETSESEEQQQSDFKRLTSYIAEPSLLTTEEEKYNFKAEKLTLFVGDMLMLLARNLAKRYKPAIADDVDLTELQQFVMSIQETQLQEAGVPPQIWPFLREVNHYVDERNKPEYDSSAACAYLLCQIAVTNPKALDLWKGCFELVYNTSVEEKAEEGKKNEEDREKAWNAVMGKGD